MDNNDKQRFFQMMTILCEYYGKDLSESLLTIYWDNLSHYDYPAVSDAMKRHMQNPDDGRFMPKVADVVKLLEGSSLDRASSAWSKVERAIKSHGPYRTVAFDDPIIHRVIQDLGGWPRLGEIDADDMQFTANHFINRYKGFVNSSFEHPRLLYGLEDIQNQSMNLPTGKQVALIGKKEDVDRVVQLGEMPKPKEFSSISELTRQVAGRLVHEG